MALNRHTRCAVFLVALATAACSGLPQLQGQYWLKGSGPRFPSATESLVAYHAYAWNLPPADLARESESVRETVARDPSVFHRLRLAIAAAAPAAPVREHARAQQLLEQCEQEVQGDPSLKAVFVLLRNELAERRRLEERLRDETRRADELDRKLGALKAIELNLLERSRAGGVKKP